jgi:hypothetical protein
MSPLLEPPSPASAGDLRVPPWWPGLQAAILLAELLAQELEKRDRAAALAGGGASRLGWQRRAVMLSCRAWVLHTADLREANLQGANLQGADRGLLRSAGAASGTALARFSTIRTGAGAAAQSAEGFRGSPAVIIGDLHCLGLRHDAALEAAGAPHHCAPGRLVLDHPPRCVLSRVMPCTTGVCSTMRPCWPPGLGPPRPRPPNGPTAASPATRCCLSRDRGWAQPR